MMKRLAVLLALAPLLAQSPEPAPEVRVQARDAYLYAYPLVLMEMTRRAATATVGDNWFTHLQKFPDDRFRQVIRPNADTLYSTAWLDLSHEPVLLHVPDTHGRYYLMQLLDAWTETVQVPGKRTTGTAEGWFAIVGPGWKGKLPANTQRIDCPTNMAWLLGRTQTNSATDYENVHAIQRQYQLMPLSRYPDGLRRPPNPPPPEQQNAAFVPPPVAVARMSSNDFFSEFTALLEKNPPHPGDEPMLAKLAQLGIGPGLERKPNPAFEEGVNAAKELLANLETRRAPPGKTGWSTLTKFVGRYGTNYLARAAVARIGLGANPPEDAIYLSCYQDAAGNRLQGAGQYVLHLDKAQLPPVRAFWSLAMYSDDGFFVPNPIGRFAIGDRDRLTYNADGSLDIYIRHDPPGPERENNWLPAPAETFSLMLRLYWPTDAILNGSWIPPAVMAAR